MMMGHMMAPSFDRVEVAGGRGFGVGTFDIDVRNAFAATPSCAAPRLAPLANDIQTKLYTSA